MTEPIARRVGRMLRRRDLTLALAESCTGGLIGRRITAVPGSSAYFLGGVIAYGNRAKEEILGVAKGTIARYGAVSRHAASEMARGARRIFMSDIALSATGIAGPSGGSRRKPVGLVYLGIAGPGGICAEKHIFKGGRKAIQSQAADTALKMLADHLGLRDMPPPAGPKAAPHAGRPAARDAAARGRPPAR